MVNPKCKATTLKGNPCKAAALNNSVYCKTHQHFGDEDSDEHVNGGSVMSSDHEMGSGSQARSQVTGTMSDSIISETLDTLNEKIDKLEKLLQATATSSRAKGTKSVKKGPRKMTDKTANIKARWIYYNELKDTPTVIEALAVPLRKVGMVPVKKTILDDGTIVEKEHIPYTLKKAYTDLQFDKLSDAKKNKYINKAWEEHGEKVAAWLGEA